MIINSPNDYELREKAKKSIFNNKPWNKFTEAIVVKAIGTNKINQQSRISQVARTIGNCDTFYR